jgi:hypothetical protein
MFACMQPGPWVSIVRLMLMVFPCFLLLLSSPSPATPRLSELDR